MSTPILATKLYIPRLRPNVVSRPRLLDRLNDGVLKKVRDVAMPLLSVNRVAPGLAEALDVNETHH